MAATTRSLVSEVDSYQKAAIGTAGPGLAATTISYLQSRVLPQGETIMVALPDGRKLGSAGSAQLLRTRTIQAMLARPPAFTRSYRSTLGGVDTLYLVAPMRTGSRSFGTMIVAADLSQLHTDQNRVLVLVVGEALIALIGAVAGAYLLLRRLLRNVGRITTTAASIEGGELDRRLGDQGTDDEVGQLAATFDSMLDRLEAAMTVQRRLLSDVSHQLRTPLTVARGHLEVLARQSSVSLLEVQETSAAGDRRTRPHARTRRTPACCSDGHSSPTSSRSSISICARSCPICSKRPRCSRPETGHWPRCPTWCSTWTWPSSEGRLLNLIDNAVKATGPSDTVRITARLDPDRSYGSPGR